jgi:hypothetical protein
MSVHQLDIFRIERGGSLLWIGTAEDLDEARRYVAELHAGTKEFCVVDLTTGVKTPLHAGDQNPDCAKPNSADS